MMLIKHFSFIVFFLFAFSIASISQTITNKDSLYNALNALSNSTANIQKIYKIANSYDNIDYQINLDILKIAEKKFGNAKPDTLLGNIYESIGNVNGRLFNSTETIKYMLKLKDIGEALGKNKFITSAYSGIGSMYMLNNDYERAIENIKIAINYSKGDYPESDFYKAANYGSLGYDNYLFSQTLNKQSPQYQSKYNYYLQQSIKYHHLSLAIDGAKKHNDYSKAKDIINLCLSFVALPNIDSAQYYFRYTESIIGNIKDLDVKCEHEFNRGKIFEYKKEYPKALLAYKASLDFAKQLKYEEYIIENYLSLSRVSLLLGNNKDEIKYFTTYSSLRDSVITRKILVDVMQIQSDYEINKKNVELLDKTNNNKILIGLFSALSLISLLGYLIFRNRQKLQHLKINLLQKEAIEEKLKLNQLETEQLTNKLEIEQVVNFFSNLLINKSTVNDTLWDVAKNLIGKLGFEDCMMYLWNTDKTKMVQMAGYGPKGSIEEINKNIFHVVTGQGVVGFVMQSKQPVLIPDTSVDERYRMDEMNRLSEITIPILYNNELIGIIDSENSSKNFYTERHLIILQTIAGMIAIKIKTIESENALQLTKIKLLKANEELQQKQLQAVDAMLKGQEEERSRIAKDLHDGLGGMLSGTKLSFINMKENLVLTPENAIQFDKSLSMLDNTIADLRKVAHNLMPEALVKFGLDEAVKDFCSSIQSSSNLKVVYQQVGEKRKLTNTAEVFTYRIIQELVNNAVKHAGAKQIIVQLNINTHKLSITVEDDGKGFDVNSMANSKGAGMDNIKYRVQYLNGTLDIVTAPGNGTSVNIELGV